jgi:uncharacterized repeat protein (TIGR03806 family)
MMAQIPGDASRWFVAERGSANGGNARVVSFPTSSPTAESKRVVATVGPLQYVTGEGGLLGLAFHPDFSVNGRLYVTWVTTNGPNSGRSVVGYLTSTNGGVSFDDYNEILSFAQPTASHKGGGIAFGLDGYLYLSFGDGAYPADDMAMGQNKNGMFAKVLRIDVDAVPEGKTYGIPEGNPFEDGGGEPATFAWGFRNPFRISIDRESGELWVGDVGDAINEEINLVRNGENYGWPCREGTLDFLANDPLKCPSTEGLSPPVIEQNHFGASRSITGGVVYRGKAIPDFVGTYVFGDFVTQEVFGLTLDGASTPTVKKINGSGPTGSWTNFAEDQDGEIYALSMFGHSIYKLVPSPHSTDAVGMPERLSQTGCVDPSDPKKPSSGLTPYGVNAELWSDDATKQRWLAIPDGTTMSVDPDGHLELPIGSVTMKTFSIDGRLVETRLLMRHEDGDWGGYAYAWSDDQTDAVLARGPRIIGDRVWTIPSRSDCLRCHTVAAKRSLGLTLSQLDRLFPPDSANAGLNQVDWLTQEGMLTRSNEAARQPLPNPFGDAPIEARARAYLHANCSSCHQPGGGGRSAADFRFTTTFADTHVCEVLGAMPLGEAEHLLVPGAPERSLLSVRMRAPAGYFRMPPLGTVLVDNAGATLLDTWIASLSGCP